MNNTERTPIRTPRKSPRTTHIMLILMAAALLISLLAVIFVVVPSLSGDKMKNHVQDPLITSHDNSIDPDSTLTQTEKQPYTTDSMREVRGVYIASVYNINYPSKKGLSADELRAELDSIVETCLKANLNAIYFQVRPSADSLYKSDIFPTSEYLSGTQGDALPDGFDPLAYLTKIAKKKNIDIHAWVNPLRVTVGSQTAPKHDVTLLAEGHPARENPDYVIPYADGRLYFDCGNPEVRKLIADGVAEIAANYDVRSIIFDDYFYPYPVYDANKLASFDDSATYSTYGGEMSLDDWRRDNVNRMIEDCYNAIKAVDSDCDFGVAPFGIWKNDNGENGGSSTSGLESYSAIYCDPTAWIRGEYIDYIAPQIYWRFTSTAAPYDVLVRWWNTLLDGSNVELLISHGVYNYDTWENPENELRCQVEFARAELAYRGSILYGYAALKNNSSGLLDETEDVFAEEIVYSEISATGRDLIISIPYSGSEVDGEGTFVIGTSDPTAPLYIDGKQIGRTKSGYFSAYLPLEKGKNTFIFTHKGVDTKYVINRPDGTSGGSTVTHPTLESPGITAVTPSYSWMGDTALPVSVTAPRGSRVTAELGGKKITLTPTLYVPYTGKYTKEVYTGSFAVSAPKGQITDLGTVKFTSTYGGKTYTAESASIRVRGEGAYLPVEVINNDTELKIEPDSWYYDDYTVQAAGMRENAVHLGSGMYKLRCGGYISEDKVRVLDEKVELIAEMKDAVMECDDEYTYFKITVSENVPINTYMENGEFCVTLYNVNTDKAPKASLANNPLFTEIRGEVSTKAQSYKYFFKLVNIENFYGFNNYYKDGTLVFKWKNPESLPSTEKPLAGKTIVLDAGHGGKNPGALGPLGAAEGAMNESDFNLEIVMSAEKYIKNLGADVILIRDRETPNDVPVTERIETLIDISPDLVISIHQNSMPYTTDITRIRGVVGLYWADSGYMLTDIMGETIATALNKLDRSSTKQRLAMVRNPKFPATLLETCFITSVEEYERMMKPDAIETIAKSIADGVIKYYKAQEKYILSE